MAKGSIEWEHTPGEELVVRIKNPFKGMDAGETRKHIREARKEMLLAARSLIDLAVKRMEEKEQKAENPRTKIKVE